MALVRATRSLISLFTTFTLLICFCNITAAADAERTTADDERLTEAVENAFDWELQRLSGETLCGGICNAGEAGESEGDWFALAQAVFVLDDEYYGEYADIAAEKLSARLTDSAEYKLTELSRTALVLKIVSDKRFDLSEVCGEYDDLAVNELIWYIIAQKAVGGDHGDAATELVERQRSDGSFEGSPDLTAMALCALDTDSKEAKLALNALREYYADNGGDITTETAAQIIIGLCAQGINPSQDIDFTDGSGVRPLDVLLCRICDDGGFAHADGGESDAVATVQSLIALAALLNYSDGGNVYLMEDRCPLYEASDFAKETFDDYDLALLRRLETPEAGDHGDICLLMERAELYGAGGDIVSEIEYKLSQSEQRLDLVRSINDRIRSGFYPADDISVFRLYSLHCLNAEISELYENERSMILDAEELSERERRLILSLSASAAIICIVSLITLITFKILKGGKKHEKNG